ncbi:MAG: hypothetical protein RL404_1085 [Pseudomonadota bacterium]
MRIQRTIKKLKATNARLDALAVDTAAVEARIAAQRRTQHWLLFVTLLLIAGTAGGAVWFMRALS